MNTIINDYSVLDIIRLSKEIPHISEILSEDKNTRRFIQKNQKGYIKVIALGVIEIFILEDIVFEQDRLFSLEASTSEQDKVIDFTLLLEDQSSWLIQSEQEKRTLKGGCFLTSSLSSQSTWVQKGHPVSFITFYFNFETFQYYFKHPSIEELHQGKNFIHSLEPIPAPIVLEINPILKLIRADNINNLHLVSKIWGLLSLFLEAIEQEAQIKQAIPVKEWTLFHQAREIIEENYQNPKPLEEVGKMVGTSLSKLQKGFLLLFGCPPHQYLIKYRMEKAKELLLSGQYSSKEVGYEIGYSNLSHFIRLFKRTYGFTPNQLLKSERPSL